MFFSKGNRISAPIHGKLNNSNIHLKSDASIKFMTVIATIELAPVNATMYTVPFARFRNEVLEMKSVSNPVEKI